jgi:proline dehydrogenase
MNALLKARPVRQLAAACLAPVLRRAARSYVAGDRLDAALQVRQSLAARGAGCTLGFFNRDADPADRVVGEYLEALRTLSGSDDHLSIKPPAIGFDRRRLQQVAEHARRSGVRVHLDSHGPEFADDTLDSLQYLLDSMPPAALGVTLPARWQRSVADADWVRERGLPVRLVKGQWPDPRAPSADIEATFLSLVERLAGSGCRVAVASHDVVLAEQALRRLQAAGNPCEMELLYGLPAQPSLQLAARLQVPVRFYLPYGVGHLPYMIGKALEQPYLIRWLLRDFCNGVLGRH